jgi:hypothetical protein
LKLYEFLEFGGSGEIRTHGGRKPSSVFKTGALNRSATLPMTAIISIMKNLATIFSKISNN